MISKRNESHYLVVKKLSVLLQRKTSKINGDFYCLNCLYSFRAESKSVSNKNSVKFKII